jgi:hypothetical protein
MPRPINDMSKMIQKTVKQGNSHRTERAVWIAGMLIGCLAAGCGCGRNGPERAVVSGKVTFRGELLKQGQIRFIPIDGSDVPASGALILDGQYTADGNGGVPVGAHRVEILAGLRTGLAERAQEASPPSSPKAKESSRSLRLPAKYNSQSQLEITVKSRSARITRDFVLTD